MGKIIESSGRFSEISKRKTPVIGLEQIKNFKIQDDFMENIIDVNFVGGFNDLPVSVRNAAFEVLRELDKLLDIPLSEG